MVKKYSSIICLLISWNVQSLIHAEQIAHWDFTIPAGSRYGDTITASLDTVSFLPADAENINETSARVFYASPHPDLGGASADIRGGGLLKVSDSPVLSGHNDGGSGFSALTIDAYIYLRTLPGSRAQPGMIVRKTGLGGSNRPGYQFYVSEDGKLNFTLADGNAVSSQGSASSEAGAVETKKWYRVTGTWDGHMIRVYIDGLEVGCRLYNASSGKSGVLDADTTGDFCIGGWKALNGTCAQQINGMIDDVTIYNNALPEPPSEKLSLVY